MTLSGAQVAAERTARGWSQRVLADKAGVTDQTISNIERDESTPSLETAIAVARALGVPVEALFLSGSSSEPVETGASAGTTEPSRGIAAGSPADRTASETPAGDGEAEPVR